MLHQCLEEIEEEQCPFEIPAITLQYFSLNRLVNKTGAHAKGKEMYSLPVCHLDDHTSQSFHGILNQSKPGML